MFLISCPFCGPRDGSEFTCGGEAHRRRPGPPEAVTDAEWADYLFMRENPKGLHRERWYHVHGCHKWFHAVRNTATDEIVAVYRIGDPPPPTDRLAGPLATPSGEPVIGSGARAIDPPAGQSPAAGEAAS